ncbi:unnamed protein product [Heterobilharzia americana]|nr:unnamed protein product [Heterobilharzia americana]CAH8541413.1 unnamed protein product [Heterobilharzia americana]
MPKFKGKLKVKRGTAKKSGKTKRKTGGSLKQRKPKRQIDILSKDAMENLYYIAHNAPSSLIYRGFRWSGAKPKKKKGKRKGRKKN